MADEERCLALCNILHGHFYAYRRAASGTAFVKSFVKIYTYSMSDKIARFINIMANEVGEKRDTEGQVVELGDSLAFVGFVNADDSGEGDFVGIKCIIVSRPSSTTINKMSGVFMSKGDGNYHFGRMVLVRTQDSVSNMDIGIKKRREVRDVYAVG